MDWIRERILLLFSHPVPKGGKEVKIGIFEKEDSLMIFGSTALVISLIAKKLMKPANI